MNDQFTKMGGRIVAVRGIAASLERYCFRLNRNGALAFCLSMIFSENRLPPRIIGERSDAVLWTAMSGAGFFGIVR
jgi:hypothetical protein